MKPENAIEVTNVRKQFRIFSDRGNTLKERTLFSKRRKFNYREVLKGISFEVRKGEAIGLIGHNGCGKSTTLKLLTRIIYPDEGRIEMRGRVSSLIELGAGFHPDFSGRENIYINAAIFGLKRKEIEQRMDDIIAFSELEEFIDNPVRTYSSGMYMRLAFAVAINVDADILLIDEILAVGDANFQAKCFNKLREIKAKGTTIVIVSHSLGQIEQICERTIWIHDGQIREEGSPREVHPVYLDFMGQKRQEIAEKEIERKVKKVEIVAETLATESVDSQVNDNSQEVIVESDTDMKRWGNGLARIIDIALYDNDGIKKNVFETGSDIMLEIKYRVKKPIKDAVFGIGVFRKDGIYCYGSNTRLDKVAEFDLNEDGIARVKMKDIMLMPGQYSFDIAIESEIGIPVDYFREAIEVEFYTTRDDVGLVRLEHSWDI